MNSDFKTGDCVRLKNGYSPNMTINTIYPELHQAKCVWWDIDGKFFRDQDFDLDMLKPCPPNVGINIPTFINEITPPDKE